MKSILPFALAVFAGAAILFLTGGAAWGVQPADIRPDLKQAQEFYAAGQKHMREGDFTAANDAFEKAEMVLSAVETLPAIPAPEVPAQLPAQQGAGRRGASAVPADTLDPNIYFNLGVGALQKGDFIQAEAAFLRVVDLSPLDKESFYNLGVLYEKYLDRPKDALKYYKRYIDLCAGSARDVETVKGWIKGIKERVRN
jgi:tetratricopeptide (TPR) repeat protein